MLAATLHRKFSSYYADSMQYNIRHTCISASCCEVMASCPPQVPWLKPSATLPKAWRAGWARPWTPCPRGCSRPRCVQSSVSSPEKQSNLRFLTYSGYYIFRCECCLIAKDYNVMLPEKAFFWLQGTQQFSSIQNNWMLCRIMPFLLSSLSLFFHL